MTSPWVAEDVLRLAVMTPRAFFNSVETEERGKALFAKARPLRTALDRNDKRSSLARDARTAP
jgi:hypothetical protein